MKLNQVEEEFYNLRKRHALSKVIEETFHEFASEMTATKKQIMEQLQKLEQRLSNPKERIDDTWPPI